MQIFLQKNADISKIKRALTLKGIFFETTYVCVLRTKFQVCSIILTSFRQGVILPSPSLQSPPPPQNEPLKSIPRLGLRFRILKSCINKMYIKMFIKRKPRGKKAYAVSFAKQLLSDITRFFTGHYPISGGDIQVCIYWTHSQIEKVGQIWW